MPSYGVVLVTVENQSGAEAIASALVQENLAACVNLFPIQSVYRWEGKICQDPEYQLLIKTDLAHFEALAARVTELHPYEVPEIIVLPITTGSAAYLAWIGETVRPDRG